MAKTVEKGRSAETGKFVSIEYVEQHLEFFYFHTLIFFSAKLLAV